MYFFDRSFYGPNTPAMNTVDAFDITESGMIQVYIQSPDGKSVVRTMELKDYYQGLADQTRIRIGEGFSLKKLLQGTGLEESQF